MHLRSLSYYMPDWADHMNETEIEHELSIKFKGCGWYHHKESFLLITPSFKDDTEDDEQFYRVSVYNRPGVNMEQMRKMFRNISELKLR